MAQRCNPAGRLVAARMPQPASHARYLTLLAATRAQARTGQQLYQVVAEATGCPQFEFNCDPNFAIGYLLPQARWR